MPHTTTPPAVIIKVAREQHGYRYKSNLPLVR